MLTGATSASAEALVQATRDIPIVMTVVGDPIATGLSTSMSRPTGNVTGFTLSSASLAAKRLEMLSEIVPGLRRVAYMTPDSPMSGAFRGQVQSAAGKLGITVFPVVVTTPESVAEGFAVADKEKVQAVLIESSPTSTRLSTHIVNEYLLRDWPAMHAWAFEVRGGALMSYGPAVLENHRRRRSLYRSDFEGRKGCGIAVRGADRDKACHQSPHRTLDQIHVSGHLPCSRRRGDRMKPLAIRTP